MKTIIETETFRKHADKEWTIDERLEFVSWIASNSTAGDVIPGADGVRKIRWFVKDSGKRGGVRVIFYNLDQDLLLLIDMYKKKSKSSMTPEEIKRVK